MMNIPIDSKEIVKVRPCEPTTDARIRTQGRYTGHTGRIFLSAKSHAGWFGLKMIVTREISDAGRDRLSTVVVRVRSGDTGTL